MKLNNIKYWTLAAILGLLAHFTQIYRLVLI